MTPIERVTERVMRGGDVDAPGTPAPLLSLSEFFDGNDVDGSIGCNLDPCPTPIEFRQMIERVATAVGAKDVRVQITMFDDPDWPFSDTVWLMTSAPLDDVRRHFPDNWAPDEVWEGWLDDCEYEACEVPPGTRPVACWWD